MRIYISGPVTRQEETAKQRFDAAIPRVADAALEAGETLKGTEFINPYRVNQEMAYGLNKEAVTHAEYMIVSIALLSICDTIYMMSGWQQSEGCKQEHRYAMEHGYRIFYQEGEGCGQES